MIWQLAANGVESAMLERRGVSGSSSPTGDLSVDRLRDLFTAGAFRNQARSGKPVQWKEAMLGEKFNDYQYNEDLQDDLFLGRAILPMPVKNTFIHYSLLDDEVTKQWDSCPALMLTQSWHTKWPSHEEAHNRGKCRPCAYHLYKVDGCRQAFDCQFCHLCKHGEIKQRKQKKAMHMHAAREARRAAAIAAVEVGSNSTTSAGAGSSSNWTDVSDEDRMRNDVDRMRAREARLAREAR